MNDLARDSGLSKEASELLASRLHDKNLLEKGAKVTNLLSIKRKCGYAIGTFDVMMGLYIILTYIGRVGNFSL